MSNADEMTIKLNVRNILELPQVLKIPEIFFGLITLLVNRFAGGGSGASPVAWISDGIDLKILGYMTVYGLFFIGLVQLVGNLMGDKSPVQDLLVSLFGFLFYMSAGATLAHWTLKLSAIAKMLEGSKALAAMCIITSLFYLAEAVLRVINLIKSRQRL